MEDIEKTPEQIEIDKRDLEIKAKHGAIAVVRNFDKDGKPIVCYFKEPSRLVLGVAIAEFDRNVILACEYIFDDAVIREVSDVDAFRNDKGIFIGLNLILQSLVRVKKSDYRSL